MSPGIRAFVRSFYAEDFAFFAADPALAHLAVAWTDGSHQTKDAHESQAISAQIDSAAVDLAAGRVRDALDRTKAILAVHPDLPRALGLLGQIAVVAGQPAVGLASLQRAVALDPRKELRVWLALCLEKLGCNADAANVRWSRPAGQM